MGKRHKQTDLGKSMTHQDGSMVTAESFDTFVRENVVKILSPRVTKDIKYDFLEHIRFFTKIALAVGHFQFGETFTKSSWANVLREHMRITDIHSFNLLGAAIWPNVDAMQAMLKLFERENEHVIAIIDGLKPMLVISLFGVFSSIIPLGEIRSDGENGITGRGTVWRIALPFRQLSKQPFYEFMRAGKPPN